MSIEINWDTLMEDGGGQLSETIRLFLDQRFKEMALPSYLKSISVTSFDLGKVAPDIVIQRITDPFPEFYVDDDDSSSTPPSGQDPDSHTPLSPAPTPPPPPPPAYETNNPLGSPPRASPGLPGAANPSSPTSHQYGVFPTSGLYSPVFSTPNIRGFRSPLYSTVNMQSLLSTSLPPSTSPPIDTPDFGRMTSNGRINEYNALAPNVSSEHTLSSHSDPSSQANTPGVASNDTNNSSASLDDTHPTAGRETDVQLYLHIMYKGDIKVGIETTLLLNYPSPKFVSLPLKLTMSGLEINSIAALAYIDRRIHFSFICDADANGDPVTLSGKDRVEIIKDIKIESEIGDREGNGPVLRNVGKIEKFLLERLRHLARDELGWPGWITIEI